MKKYSLAVVTCLLVLLFIKLLSNYQERFNQTEENFGNKSSLNLVKGVSSEDIEHVLRIHNYLPEKSAKLVSDFLEQKFNEGQELSTLYDLDKRIWQIPATQIDSLVSDATDMYAQKLSKSRLNLGIDDDYLKQEAQLATLESRKIIDSKQSGKIEVAIGKEKENAGFIDKQLRKKEPVKDVIVRLSVQKLDSLNNSKRETIAWLKTDEEGEASFEGLDPKQSYSVLPISKGFEYGTSQGTIGGNLEEYNEAALTCSFTQIEHKIRFFDATTLKQIKEDGTLIIRSPKEFKSTLTTFVVLFFAAWWGLWLYCRLRKKPTDNVILSVLMSLTGICLLTMFSINDPLTDKLLGAEMGKGILIGVVVIFVLQSFNIKKFYQSRYKLDFDITTECIKWIFKPFRTKVAYLTAILSSRSCNVITKTIALVLILLCLPMLILDLAKITRLSHSINKAIDKLPKGFGYFLLALVLTALLFSPLGSDVGGMTVNINLFGLKFQPSEITKYFIILFIAAYFSVNANKIIQFSEKGNTGLFAAKLKMMATVIIGFGVLIGVYFKLGDMGPALVLAFTFIILYSIIKSKIDLQDTTAEHQLQKIFTCDIAMLIYGILSFIVFLYAGHKIGSMGAMCIAWFAIWIMLGIVKKQVFETPVFFNFIVAAFIFGGSIIEDIGGFESVARRLDSRTEMCTNTWGTLPLNGNTADAGSNTQVAEGLWGLASGGLWGQGLGNGTPHFIPAFHTDMILESIGEQIGFAGVLIIIMLLAVLLRRTIVLGYNTSHPFTFYLCLGIAIVTAIQFIIISLGSTGIIPLTGVTVPFLSYGNVSMILNLTAFGIILSIASNNVTEKSVDDSAVTELTKQNIGKYNYSTSLLSWFYCIFAFTICGVFFYYSFIDRNDTLIRPVYVNNTSGIPVVEYNPRIKQLTKKMHSGDIYDRNGVLLATSDKSKLAQHMASYKKAFGNDYKLDTLKRQQRYYPFAEHLAFMLGDINTDLYTFRSENSGYVAEWRHMAKLKGFDNLTNKDSTRMPKVNLSTSIYQIDKWHPANTKYTTESQLYNYSALIPYLKEGTNSDKVNNESWWTVGKIEPQDIYLTIDAELQTLIQKRMLEWITNQYENNQFRNRIRASVVIIDAANGDLLASANYPLPDTKRLESEIINDKIPTYNDSQVSRDWESYTDMDLGLIYPTAPGSTAKIMSALAALQKRGVEAAKIKNSKYSYQVLQSQLVGDEWAGHINMMEAVWRSSNCYFINLVNDHELYPNLLNVYRTVGAQLGKTKAYGILYSDSIMSSDSFNTLLTKYNVSEAVAKYRKYIENKCTEKMNDAIWQWTWGQGELSATPITMARVASIVANDGMMSPTRFTIDDRIEDDIKIVTKEEADSLGVFMKYEAEHHIQDCKIKSENNIIGGKTGTANRHLTNKNGKTIQRSNDSWYICYIKPTNKDKSPLAIAVRIERGQSSRNAKKMLKDLVLDILDNKNYIDK